MRRSDCRDLLAVQSSAVVLDRAGLAEPSPGRCCVCSIAATAQAAPVSLVLDGLQIRFEVKINGAFESFQGAVTGVELRKRIAVSHARVPCSAEEWP